MTIQAYFMRHGYTDMSPSPERWSQIPLNNRGRIEAVKGALWLRQLTTNSGAWPQPDHVVCSDLSRSKQTADIAAQTFGILSVTQLPELRAYNDNKETPDEYDARTASAINHILAEAGRPLIVGHRSTTAYLDKAFLHKDVNQQPDYVHYKLLHEGGSIAITQDGLIPLFRTASENWPDRDKLPIVAGV